MQYDFVPIAERELRVAARRKGTYRFRWWAALLAIGASSIWLFSGAAAPIPGQSFSPLFAIQTACAFGLALLAGAFFTSDCLSEEKRDGTLGLLFLTNLKAGDIVVGKFVALSLSAFTGLLALLPITAVPLLFGGVGVAEFWRMALALLNTLFFSLAVGLSVSTFVTDYSRGLAATLCIVALFGVVLPGVVELVCKYSGANAFWFALAWLSPFYAFACAGDAAYAVGRHKFWISLLASHSLGWISLALAGSRLGRIWQDRSTDTKPVVRRTKPGVISSRRALTHDTFDPVLRLVGPMPLLRWAVWLPVAGWAAFLCLNRLWPNQTLVEWPAARVCAFLLKLLFAFQACRFFVETRRNGALELLLCTPLRNSDLIQAQWRALRQIFLWPVVIFLVLSWTALVFPSGQVSPAVSPPTGPLDLESRFSETFFLSACLGADLFAAGWFGMWLALTMRKPGLAPGLTILAVLILPILLYRLDLLADMLFISWGSTRFQQDFRWQAALSLPPPRG